MKTIKIGSDFSGVGAFDYVIGRVAEEKGFKTETVFACDWDKYARITYAHNHGEPKYYPKDVYNREIPKKSLDIYMTSPPCQAFSLAGNRKGKKDKRGVLFFNSLEFIEKNKPRFFIFENVKGLLSDDEGRTFSEWVNLLGGKSVNGLPVIFPYEGSVPYHLYYKVLNSKKHGVPQNRERIFIIGIRDDQDNKFQFPKEEYLTKKLKDVLEKDVDDKYFLGDKTIKGLLKVKDNFNGKFEPLTGEESNSKCITTKAGSRATDNFLKIRNCTKLGYDIAKEGDSINLSFPKSTTKRGRVGHGVSQILDTSCNLGVLQLNDPKHSNDRIYSSEGCSPTLNTMQGGNRQPFIELKNFRIRKLTPRECFRLQDFPESFDFSVVSNSQAYKQAGNSITVRVLEKILTKLNL